VFSAKLTPGTRLPNAFDNFIHNNLGSVETLGEESKAVHKVSKEIGQTRSAEILSFLTTELPWANIKSINTIVQRALKVEDGRIESHYIFQSFAQLGEFRYAMINLVRNQDSFKIVVSYEHRQAFGIHEDTIYHDVRSSFYGLPSDSEFVLFNDHEGSPEFHEFNKNRLLADLKDLRGTSVQSLGVLDVIAATATAKVVVNTLCDCYKSVVDAFKTVDNESLKKTISGNGFTQFQKSSRFVKMVGVPIAQYEPIKKSIMTLLGMDKNKNLAKEIDAVITLAQWITKADWGADEFTFDVNTGGTCNSAMSLSKAHLSDQMFSVIVVVINSSFQLAPNILIYEKFKSVAGGIIQTTSEKRVNENRALTLKDYKAINNMVKVSTLQSMAKELGVNFSLPNNVFPR
jgi:hypothetical protein